MNKAINDYCYKSHIPQIFNNNVCRSCGLYITEWHKQECKGIKILDDI